MSGVTNLAHSWQREVQPTVQRPSLGSRHQALGRALTLLLAGCAAISGLRVLLDLYGITLFHRWAADSSTVRLADGEYYDTMSQVHSVLFLLVYVATGIVTMTWLFQAYGSREADPELLPHPRWWTIGGWVIPFVSIVRPFQLVRDLYLATAGERPRYHPDGKVIVPGHFWWWWACYLSGGVLSYISLRLLLRQPDLGMMQAGLAVSAISQLILIVAAVLFIGVLGTIKTNLWHRAEAA
jgi:hypothetical protein